MKSIPEYLLISFLIASLTINVAFSQKAALGIKLGVAIANATVDQANPDPSYSSGTSSKIGFLGGIYSGIHAGKDLIFRPGAEITEERAAWLKQAGLTGLIVSPDHWIPELHNTFRGMKNAFEWAEKAVAHGRNKNLVACLSLCATKEFINSTNL